MAVGDSSHCLSLTYKLSAARPPLTVGLSCSLLTDLKVNVYCWIALIVEEGDSNNLQF